MKGREKKQENVKEETPLVLANRELPKSNPVKNPTLWIQIWQQTPRSHKSVEHTASYSARYQKDCTESRPVVNEADHH